MTGAQIQTVYVGMVLSDLHETHRLCRASVAFVDFGGLKEISFFSVLTECCSQFF